MNPNKQRFDEACARWVEQGVRLEDGLRDDEFEELERTHSFSFPPDLRELLEYRVPVGPRFLDWRSSRDDVQKALNRPIEGILFDVETNGFWWMAWGPRPDRTVEARDVATKAIEQAPRLVPVLGIRYIPSRPSRPNNPIFSVQQTDVLVMHRNLTVLLEDIDHQDYAGEHAMRIEFWSDLVEWSQLGHQPDWKPRAPDAVGEMHPPPLR